METTTLSLSDENQKKLEYIRQKTNLDIQASIAAAIDAYYQQLQNEKDPLARFKQSPLIGSFQGEPDLAERSEAIYQSLLSK
jgi:predicted transcriptional regulator